MYRDLFQLGLLSLFIRQGENLSSILVALYLSDLEACLKSRLLANPDVLSETEDHLNTNLHENMFTLLYANDTVLFAETNQGL